jgi:hypothetical protein
MPRMTRCQRGIGRVVHLILTLVIGVFSVSAIADASAPIEFPPGRFTDDVAHRVADCRDKLLVLCFYNPHAPRNWGDPETTNWLIGEFHEDPVKFIAVAPGLTLAQLRQTAIDNPEIPAFADALRWMQHRAGPAEQNTQWAFTLVGPDGHIVGKPGEDLATVHADLRIAVKDVRWRFRGREVPQALEHAADDLEWGRWAAGMNRVRPLLHAGDLITQASANAYNDTMHDQASALRDKATAAEHDDPITAYDCDGQIAEALPADPLGRAALRAMRRLEKNTVVRDELAARWMWRGADEKSESPREMISLCENIVQLHPNSPTGKRTAALITELRLLPMAQVGQAAAAPDFVIRIHSYAGAAGFGINYQITPDEISVGVISDWAGQRPKELYRQGLSLADRRTVQMALEKLPLRALNNQYVDPNVNDGFQCTFEFAIRGQPPKSIFVGNRPQADLEAFCDEVDKLLPEKLKINFTPSNGSKR